MHWRRRIPGQRLPAIPDEHRYALATAAGGVAVWDWDLSTNDLFVDPALRAMLGYNDAPIPDRIFDWARLVHPEDREQLFRQTQFCLSTKSNRFEFEHRMLHRSGGVRWFMTRGSAMRDEQGCAVRVLGTTTEVTERKLVQLALRESEERFRQLAEHTPQIFWLMPADMSRLLYISPAYEEITGYPCDELYEDPRHWMTAVHPQDRSWVSKAYGERQKGIRTGRTHMEYRYQRPDGTIRWMQATIFPILDESGTPYRIAGIAEDITERKLTQSALRESESRFRQIAEHTPHLFWLMPADMQSLLYINPAYDAITGYNSDELYHDPTSWFKAVHPEDRERVMKAFNSRRTGQITAPAEIEYRYLRPDGEVRWIQANVVTIFEESGAPFRFAGIAEDITERKRNEELLRQAREELTAKVEQRTMELSLTVRRLEQEIAERARAEESLRHSEFRSRRLFESNFIGTLIADVHGNLMEANDALLKMIGYTRDEIPLCWENLVPLDMLEIVNTKREEVLREGVATPFEVEIFRKDGERVPIYIGAALLDSQLGTFSAFVVDQTERKQAEQQLRESEARFRRLFESNIIGAMICDIHGVIYHANDAMLKIIGYSGKDLPLRWDNMTPLEWRYTDERALEQLAQNGIALPWEKEYIRKDGSRVSIMLGVAMLPGDECISFVLDLTDLKRAEAEIQGLNAQLEQASRLSMMGETVAALAHEVHQPLAAMANYANGTIRRLKQRETSVAEITERLSEIAAESLRAADVLRRVRQFLQLREPKYEKTNINLIVQDALKLVRIDREEHCVDIIFQPEQELPTLLVDPIQMTQVTLNLILNGIQALKEQGGGNRKVVISTRVTDEHFVEVSVIDTGAGVPSEMQSRIFEQFFTTKPDGLGMGLSISRSIVEAHGGRLWYETGRDGNAVFRFSLPTRHSLPESGSRDAVAGTSYEITAISAEPE